MLKGQLDGIITFVTVATDQNFSTAATRLGISPSAVSQSVRNLEKRLGTALFTRNTRGVRLTEAGQRYFERVQPALRELELASDELRANAQQPTGLLRINVARAGFMIVLQPILQRFMALYPEIKLEVCIESTLTDIVRRGFDAGIRFGHLVEHDMVAIQVGPPIQATLLASPGYIARNGTPMHPHDLMKHDCIGFRQDSSWQIERWRFERDGETLDLSVEGRLIVNDSATLVQSAIDGLGVAYMINGYVERLIDKGLLVRLLSDWSPKLPGFTLFFPNRRHVAPKLRVFIDFLRSEAPIESSPGLANFQLPKDDG